MTQQADEIADVLLKLFDKASSSLLAKLLTEQDSMSPEAIEDAKYVIGMVEVNTINLQKVADQGASYYQDNKKKVDRLIAEATTFAEALMKEGY